MNILDFAGFKSRKETTKTDTLFSPKIKFFEKKRTIEPSMIKGFVLNKPIPFNKEKMIQAIKNGMLITILYKGEDDKWKGGRERTIYPMVLGINKNTGNMLLRAWHLEGYSVSNKQDTEKVWRLFKTDNIKSMSFSGDMYRLLPKGYKMNDRVMTEKTIIRAKYNTIVKNQKKLLMSGEIENTSDKTLSTNVTIDNIILQDLEDTMNLKDQFANKYLLGREKDAKNINVIVLKSVLGNNWMYVLNTNATEGRTAKVEVDGNKMGAFKVVKSFSLDQWKANKNVRGKTEMPLYKFLKKK